MDNPTFEKTITGYEFDIHTNEMPAWTLDDLIDVELDTGIYKVTLEKVGE